MKKRSLLLLALAAVMAVPFASCGDDSESGSSEHEHTYETVWSADATNHWYGATCEHTDQKANLAAHADDDNDGVCDVCDYAGDHTHTYATEWSKDATNHWYAATCNHAVKKDEAAHADENNDGVCDTCSYDYGHTHTYATEWSKDETNHWYAVTCGHTVAVKDQAAHADENNDGNCDTCGWYDETHTHTFAEVWSKDETNHWYAATCEHTGAKKDVAGHTDENNDNLCDTCGWMYDPDHEHEYNNEQWAANGESHWHAATCGHNVTKGEANHFDYISDNICDTCGWTIEANHTHEYETEWSLSLGYHYKATTCGHTAVSLRQTEAHKDENTDDICDVCGMDMDIDSIIDKITSADATAKVSGGNIKYTGLKWNDDYTDRIQADPVDLPYLYGVNYTMSTSESYGTYYYVPYTAGETNKVLSIQVSEGEVVGVQASEDTSVLTQGYYFQLCNWCIEEYGVENLVYEFYSLKDESFVYGFDFIYDATTMAYTINMLYYENESNVYEISATFVANVENIITELDMTIKTLGEGTYTLNDTDKTYTLTEAAANSLAVYYEVTQTVGARSEDASPYDVNDFILSQDDLSFTYGEATVVNGSSITVGVTDWSNKALLSLSETAGAKYLAFTDGLSYEIADSSLASIGVPYGTSDIYIWGKAAGTTTMTISSDFGSITFNVTVDWAEITSFEASAATEMYAGLSTQVSVTVNSGANPAFTAEVTTKPEGATASVEDGVFTADIAGEYVITLTSVQDSTLTATVTITVNEAPSVADVLNGTYSYENYYQGQEITVVFTPASTGATSGTVVITSIESGMDYSTWEEYTNEYTETLTYTYADGVITLTHVSGDELGYTLSINDSYGVSICTMPMYPDYYTFEMTKVETTPTVDYANELWGTTWYDMSSNTYLIFDTASTGIVTDATSAFDSTWAIVFDFTVDAEGNITLSNINDTGSNAPISLNTAGFVFSDISEVNLTYPHPMTGIDSTLLYTPYVA
ncbi:MAG: hypothetical protein IJX91_00210 [Clostridia bacterium]|nr:hypothetical protein [Clostridia bacterium]